MQPFTNISDKRILLGEHLQNQCFAKTLGKTDLSSNNYKIVEAVILVYLTFLETTVKLTYKRKLKASLLIFVIIFVIFVIMTINTKKQNLICRIYRESLSFL